MRRLPPCSRQSRRPLSGRPTAGLDRPCARRRCEAWSGRKDGPRSRTKGLTLCPQLENQGEGNAPIARSEWEFHDGDATDSGYLRGQNVPADWRIIGTCPPGAAVPGAGCELALLVAGGVETGSFVLSARFGSLDAPLEACPALSGVEFASDNTMTPTSVRHLSNTVYLPCSESGGEAEVWRQLSRDSLLTTFAPIFISSSLCVVSDQSLIGSACRQSATRQRFLHSCFRLRKRLARHCCLSTRVLVPTELSVNPPENVPAT